KDAGVALTGGVVTLTASGVATYTTTTLTSGSHAITADYSGDSGFTPSTSGTLTQVGKAASTTTLTAGVNPAAPGQAGVSTATVTGPGGPPTGTVTFKEGTTALGT